MPTRVDTFEASEKKKRRQPKKTAKLIFTFPHYEKMETSSRNIVTKRNGRTEAFDEGKFKAVLNKFAGGLDHVDTGELCAKTVQSMPDQIDTDEILRHLAATAASYAVDHPDYDRLAARAFAAHLHKRTPTTFPTPLPRLTPTPTRGTCPWSRPPLQGGQQGNAEVLDQMVVPSRDESLTYLGREPFSAPTSSRATTRPDCSRRPSTCSCAWPSSPHRGRRRHAGPGALEGVRKTGEAMSTEEHARRQRRRGRLCNFSCFLLAMKDDSIEGIFDTIHQCAKTALAA